MNTPVDPQPQAAATATTASAAIPIKKVMPWAILGGLVAVIAYYFVGAEQGATSLFNGSAIHEFVHDARHLLGFPCH
jgi:hypothetical protein